jgi:disulfide bond formation protein DsbB
MVDERVAGRAGTRGILGRAALFLGSLAAAAGLYVAHAHYAVQGQSTPSLGCLAGAAALALVPLKSLIGELFAIEAKFMHLAHGIGGIGLVGLSLGGGFSGGHVLTHAALAPFAIMGAAQAMMHQDHPRNAAQAAAMRRFATSLPEVEQISRAGNLRSPQNAARAIAVISDLIGKAQALGETELQADPGFQNALRRTTTRFGLTLGLDSVQKALNTLARNPATAQAVPGLRRRLDQVRAMTAGSTAAR